MTDEAPDNDVAASTLIADVVGSDDALAAAARDTDDERPVPRKQVFSWALWDWSTQPYNTVILSFVFVPNYLLGATFLNPSVKEGTPAYDRALGDLSSWYGYAIAIASLLLAVLAPAIGQRADGDGKRKLPLAVSTSLLVLSMAGLFFVEGKPSFFLLGIALVAAGSVFSDLAGATYNSMLSQVSTPKTVGKISGLGWGFGYLGGIVMLIIVVVAQQSGWFGIPDENGLPLRVVAVACAVWTIVFSLPIFLNVPDPVIPKPEKVGFFRSYVLVARGIKRLFTNDRPTFWFLLASAVYRDGLNGVFQFGGAIAAITYGFEFIEVVAFGVAANIVAGISTILSGRADDKFGPKRVILFSLGGLVIAGLSVFVLHDAGKTIFWIGGLVLSIFVGPAQAASRSLLSRVTPRGQEGEVFGLYATTGRAASYITPTLWGLTIGILGAQYWGILAIVFVLAVGFVLMLLIKLPTFVPDNPRKLP